MPDDEPVPGLSGNVAERLRSELGEPAEKIVRCLRTAEVLIGQAMADDGSLRLAESAAYNVREALNAVVEDREDAAEGGLPAVMDAWRRFKVETAQPDADTTAARDALEGVLARVEADESRASYHTRKLLSYLRDRAGVSPASRRGDPLQEYRELRKKANGAVHTQVALAEAEDLLARTVAWFIRVFTPPDEVVNAIRSLAAEPWRGQDQIAALERLATNDHHLRLFFSELADPAWLEPLRLADVAPLQSRPTLWPVAALLEGLGRTWPQKVAEFLGHVLTDTTRLPVDERAGARFEVLRVAVQLGSPGHDVVVTVVRQHGDLAGVRALSVDVAGKADPADRVVERVADSVLNDIERFRDGDNYYATTLLDHLQAGITAGNVEARVRMLAGKTRRRSRDPESKYVVIGIESLTADPGDHPEPLVLLAHHLVRVLSKARSFDVQTSVQQGWLGNMTGELGERIHCQVLAGADDVGVAEKIAHIARRLESPTATGDDLALVADIQSRNPDPDDLASWISAFGTPSTSPADGEDTIPEDWFRAWRWAAILPDHVLAGWREPISYVTRRHGKLNTADFSRARTTGAAWTFGRSPYTPDQLAALPTLEVAELVAAWQPDANDRFFSPGPLELARALQVAIEGDPVKWCVDPVAVVTRLREPIYIEHYFRALVDTAADIIPQASIVLGAAGYARTFLDSRIPIDERPSHSASSLVGVHEAILDLAAALANADADISASLDDLWKWTRVLLRDTPDSNGELLLEGYDPLASAMNRPWGHALMAMLPLAAWEFRHRGAVRPEFECELGAVIRAPGAIGLEFRAVLAAHRPLLEHIAGSWLEAIASALFRDGDLARETFDLTIRWARPTPWLYQRFNAELFDAALRGINNAVRQIVVATLNEMDGYDQDEVIHQLRKVPAVLASAAEDVAFNVQNAESDSPFLARAVRFWTRLLDPGLTTIPEQALAGLGRWAFVTNVDDDQWANLTARTLATTNGRIDNAISVADRAATIGPSPTTREILLRLLDSGEPWERHHAAQKAIEVLRASALLPIDGGFHRLRIRLIDLGYHEASDITPGSQE